MNIVAGKRPRIESVDVLRGIIMIVMALDHVRDYFAYPGVNPTDLSTTTVPLFFSRWITHFCAPVFFLLTGTGSYLSLRRKSKRQLSWFLLTRGLWLIFLELVVLRCLAWQFNFDYRLTILVVIWALGWAMIVLSALCWLSDWAVIAFGVIMIAGHNLFDAVRPQSFGAWAPLWSILHSPNVVYASPRHVIFVAYPLIPWVGVTAVGYGLGKIFSWPSERRRKLLLQLGAGLTLAFILLRAVNIYGDPFRWAAQRSPVFTFLSFLNTTKYPPSLLFLLMTLGPALLLLRAVDSGTPGFLRPALIVGKVPLFYYGMHVVFIHVLAVIVCYVRYRHVYWMFESPGPAQYPVTPPPGWGFNLSIIYLIWAGIVLAIYPLCRWFAALKQRRSDPWLSYL
jgi:uncharacterized membrane protein